MHLLGYCSSVLAIKQLNGSSIFLCKQEEMKKLAKSERLAVHISNATNLVLFVAKVYASMESRSMAVIASTLDSLLDLLSDFISGSQLMP